MRPSRSTLIEVVPVALLVLSGTALAFVWALSTTEWRVMTDELAYVKSALSMGDDITLRPSIRGVPSNNYGILYPGLLAPLVSAFDMPTAFRLAHAVGALLMASAAIPAYLLARFVAGSPRVALVAAAPVALTPWLLFSLNLLTEALAYPVFAWWLYASVVAVSEPSVRWDLTVLAACVVAFLARTQFVFLVALVPLMAVLHEVGMSIAGQPPRRWLRRIGAGLRAAVTGHKVLAGVVVLALLLVAVAPSRVPLGDYAAVRSASLIPAGFFTSAVEHLNHILFGIAFLPMVLALAFAGENLIRPASRRAQTLAAHVLVVVPVLVAVATSFDLTFSRGIVNERYVFYLAPLVLVAAACYPAAARWPLRSLAISVTLVGLCLTGSAFTPVPDAAVYGSPARSGWVFVDGRVAQFGQITGLEMGNGLALALATGVAVAVLASLLRADRRGTALALAGAGMVVWSLALTLYVGPKVQTEHDSFALQALSAPGPLGGRDWIDRALPDGATAALLPSGINARGGGVVPTGTITDQGVWWQAEFWNKSVTRSYVGPGAADFTPYSRLALSLNPRSGRVRVPGPPSGYLVAAPSNVLLRVRGRVVARNADLELLRPDRPYRAAWATEKLPNSGLLGRDLRTSLRLFGTRGAARRQHVTLTFVGQSQGRPVEIRGPGSRRDQRVFGRSTIRASACVPAGGSRALTMGIAGPNTVRLIDVQVRIGAPCATQ